MEEITQEEYEQEMLEERKRDAEDILQEMEIDE